MYPADLAHPEGPIKLAGLHLGEDEIQRGLSLLDYSRCSALAIDRMFLRSSFDMQIPYRGQSVWPRAQRTPGPYDDFSVVERSIGDGDGDFCATGQILD